MVSRPQEQPEAWKLAILAVFRVLGAPVFLIRGLSSVFGRSPGRGKKPKEGVWGKLRSWFPLWEPTDSAEEPIFAASLLLLSFNRSFVANTLHRTTCLTR